MSRKKKIAVYCIVIIVLAFSYLRLSDKYITPERAFYAVEIGLHYGPSYDIPVKYSLDDDAYIMIGKHDYGLSFVEVERTMMFFWKMKSGAVMGNIPFEYMKGNLYVNFYNDGIYNKSFVWGYSNNEYVKTIKCSIEGSDDEYITGEVFESGIFFIPVSNAFEYKVIKVEGLDLKGNVIEEFEF